MPFLRACLPHSALFACCHSYRLAARSPAVSPLRPASRVEERGAISCLPCLSSSFSVAVSMRVRCHERRAEMMDEMMSRTLLASFFSFSRPAPSRLFSSICLLDAFPRPPGVG